MSDLKPLESHDIISSGIKPTGILHYGNYFGAIRQYIELQDAAEAFYFIVDYHALTMAPAPEELRENTFRIAVDFLALGLDPDKASLFVQSDVPEVTELTWIFSNCLAAGDLERGVSYKDAKARGQTPNAGLLYYPVLQAADILIYRGSVVPVGKDQSQNIEIANRIANRFNHRYSSETPYFVPPRGWILDDVAVVPGLDGQKMSKSYDNTIAIFEEPDVLRKKVMSIPTASTPLAEPMDPDNDHVFALIRLVGDDVTVASIRESYLKGGFGFKRAKESLIEILDGYFGEARERRKELMAKPEVVREIMAAGAEKARGRAQETMREVRELVGLDWRNA
ncbi:MAG: tryptophan--tRNA ligase [Gemmatimonadota bacterium]